MRKLFRVKLFILAVAISAVVMMPASVAAQSWEQQQQIELQRQQLQQQQDWQRQRQEQEIQRSIDRINRIGR
jgi:Ni/Co efflux regulator RcnB